MQLPVEIKKGRVTFIPVSVSFKSAETPDKKDEMPVVFFASIIHGVASLLVK